MLVLLRELALVKVWTLGLVSYHCNTIYAHFYHSLPCCFYNFRLQKLFSTIHIALISPSLRWTSAPIQFTIVLGVLGTQETLCYLVAGLLERDWGSPGLGGVRMAGLYLQPDSWTMKIHDWRLRPVSGRDFPWHGRQAWRCGCSDLLPL